MAAVQFTRKSTNRKIGAMPVSTTSAETCPDVCPLKTQGCYAKGGPLGMMWAALSRAVPGQTVDRGGAGPLYTMTWSQFTDAVRALPLGTLWRHNQAGDLPGAGDAIDVGALSELVSANHGRRGFAYTHKPLDHGDNAVAIAYANGAGFTVNVSADNLREADELAAAAVGPVVVVLPHDFASASHSTYTPDGRRVVQCPATYRDDVSCASCQLCQRQERKVIVGFPAHGASKRKASAIAAS